MSKAPKNPCSSCPYRKDVPSGVWSAQEYEKLPQYDNATGEQPIAAFFCHLQNGRLCAGWVGCHDMNHNLGLRLAVRMDHISRRDMQAALDYSTSVPLWKSGAEAAAHGLQDLEEPSVKAVKAMAKVKRLQERRAVQREEQQADHA